MNFALSTFAIFILLTPGLIFRRLYYTEEFSKQYVKQNFFELFLASFFPSLLFHSLWYYVVQLTPYKVDLNIVCYIFSSTNSEKVFANLQNYTPQIIFYHISIFSFSAIAGYISKLIVRKKKWDRRKKIFRYQNSWHYLFKGEFFDFPKAAFDLLEDKVEDIEFFYIDVLSEIGGRVALYEGILVDYELAQNGGLNYIVLKEAERKFIRCDNDASESNNHSQPIPGHILVLPNDSIVNMNISFYKLKELDEGQLQVVLVS